MTVRDAGGPVQKASEGGAGPGWTEDDNVSYGNDCREAVRQLLSSGAAGDASAGSSRNRH